MVLANRESKIYHKPTCNSAKRLAARNRLAFPGLAAAEAQGFTACQSCRPNTPLIDPPAVDGQSQGTAAITLALMPPAFAQDDAALKFSRDIAPVLLGNCLGCHNPQQKRGDLDLSTFKKLIEGPAGGPIIVAGKPAESELILRVSGESTPKMPPGNNRNLADETIDRLRKWIEAGALLDAGVDPNKPLAEIATSPADLRRQELAKMSAAERDKFLDTTAEERWKKAQPNGKPTRVAGDRVVMYGDLPEARLKSAAGTLDRAHAVLGPLLSRPNKPVLPGPMKVSIYVFKDRNSFAEFVRSVLRREVEDADQAAGDLTADVPFLVALDPLGGQEAPPADPDRPAGRPARKGVGSGSKSLLDALLVQALASGAADSAGKPPRWLSAGLGELMAAQLDPRSARVAALRADVLQQRNLGWMTKAGEALGDQGDPETVRALGFSLLEFLSTTPAHRPKYAPFVRGMLDGAEKLDEGLLVLFNASRQDLLTSWGDWAAARYGR
jgi:mono/diheme cytochrome c family protein